MPRGNVPPNPYHNMQFGIPINWQAIDTSIPAPPYDSEYYQGPPTPTPTLTGRLYGTHTNNPCVEAVSNYNAKEEVRMKVSAKDVTVCASCSSANLTETCDPMVAKECLDCGSLMLIDGDVLQMAV